MGNDEYDMKERLLEHSEMLNPNDAEKVLTIEFHVPDSCSGLVVSIDYSPKVLLDRTTTERILAKTFADCLSPVCDSEKTLTGKLRHVAREMVYRTILPLKNLITISIYDANNQFIGSACRFTKDPATFEIGTERSSPGFYPLTTIAAGTWRLDCEIRSLITKTCKLTLKVHSVRRDKTEKKGITSKVQTVSNAEPKWGWYAGELHVHSEHSDGAATIPQIVERAKEGRYDFIALTDHNTTSGHTELHKGLNYPVVKGVEYTTFRGHATALGLHSYIEWNLESNPKKINSLIDDVHLHGALFSIAHPNHIDGPICAGCRWRYADVDYSKVDLIEIWCGSNQDNASMIQHNLVLWNSLLNQSNKIVGISGLDWHELDDVRCGQTAKTYVWTSGLSEAEILTGLRIGKVYVSCGPRLDFSVTDGLVKGEIGYILPVTPGKSLLFNVDIEDVQKKAKLQICRNGLIWQEKIILPQSQLQEYFTDTVDSDSWYRLQLVDEGDAIPILLGFTNPIYITVNDR